MNVIQFIKESCDRQNAKTPEDYIGMTLAYLEVVQYWSNPNEDAISISHVRSLFAHVNNEPDIRVRHQPATFADGTHAVAPFHIVRQLKMLLDIIPDDVVTAEEVYQRFEEIHPCHDGNGRVGAILYNWLNDTLHDPIHPPEFKKL